ncbi:EcsC family protein [Aurantiacibacter spongiae]|uniref:EcsC family protein n=1 Tax=Aurantiacibacter spongiae TaxID=2488860 RepID=A0A3N5DGI3_9SPHN|nr:EcsC family protein [Aurantiacibacter spongiae]RPF70792.1 EcsC family protein [Aurantiacibacter spongiae]
MDIRRDQQRYRRSKPSWLGRGIERLTHPVGSALAGAVPKWPVQKIVEGIDTAVGAPPLTELNHDPADADAARSAAKRIERIARTVNGASGAAAGFGGALTASLDIPGTIAIALRNVRDTGVAYGFSDRGAEERMFRMQILELATLNDREERRRRMDALEASIAEDGSLRHVDPNAAKPLVDQVVERVSRALALASLRNRLGMVVPVIGSAVGAAVNSSFQSDVSKAARFGYQARWLKRHEDVIDASA